MRDDDIDAFMNYIERKYDRRRWRIRAMDAVLFVAGLWVLWDIFRKATG